MSYKVRTFGPHGEALAPEQFYDKESLFRMGFTPWLERMKELPVGSEIRAHSQPAFGTELFAWGFRKTSQDQVLYVDATNASGPVPFTLEGDSGLQGQY